MAAVHADDEDIKKITALCDEVENLLNEKKDHTQKDIEFHNAIAMSSKNVVIPRLIPVINSSIPLFVESTGNRLHAETIETHREIADAIACHFHCLLNQPETVSMQKQLKLTVKLQMPLRAMIRFAPRTLCIFI